MKRIILKESYHEVVFEVPNDIFADFLASIVTYKVTDNTKILVENIENFQREDLTAVLTEIGSGLEAIEEGT